MWSALCALHAPDEIEAVRRLGPRLERADKDGLAAAGPRIRRALASGALVPPARGEAADGATVAVPEALRLYVVEGPDLGRYDALVEAARASV